MTPNLRPARRAVAERAAATTTADLSGATVGATVPRPVGSGPTGAHGRRDYCRVLAMKLSCWGMGRPSPSSGTDT